MFNNSSNQTDNPDRTYHHTRQFTLELIGPSLAAITGIFVMCTMVNLLYKILVFQLIYKKGPLRENPGLATNSISSFSLFSV